jgi:hypothetical protein
MPRRLLLALVAVLTLGAVTAGVVPAQEEQAATTPALEIELAPNRVTIGGPGGVVAAGPTRLEFRNTSRRAPAGASLVALKEGTTLAEFRRVLPRANRGPGPLKAVATFEAGGQVAPGGRYVTTVALKADTTYVIANSAGDDATKFPLRTFTTGQTPGSGTRPEPDATVELYDFAFGMPSVVPRNGTIRFENQGERLHIAVAVPVRRGASRVAAVRAFLTNNERNINRLTDARRSTEALGVVSGETTNDVEVRFPRAGDWLFVCFIGDGERGNPSHNTLGMVKAFRVR